MILDRNTASLDTSRCNVLDREVRSKQACWALPGMECGGNKAQPHVAVRHFDPGFPNRRGPGRGRGASAGTSWLLVRREDHQDATLEGTADLGFSLSMRRLTALVSVPRQRHRLCHEIAGGLGEKQAHLSVCRYPRRLVRRRALSCFWILV